MVARNHLNSITAAKDEALEPPESNYNAPATYKDSPSKKQYVAELVQSSLSFDSLDTSTNRPETSAKYEEIKEKG